jgi:hypothetical protein
MGVLGEDQTKSISGHKTERMREHYSSVQPSEQRESIGRLLRLVKRPAGHQRPPEFRP